MNAVHGSANAADARREINFFFPNMVIDPIPSASETSSYISRYVMPTLSEGLLQLCKVKPQNPVVCLLLLPQLMCVSFFLGMVRILAT